MCLHLVRNRMRELLEEMTERGGKKKKNIEEYNLKKRQEDNIAL